MSTQRSISIEHCSAAPHPLRGALCLVGLAAACFGCGQGSVDRSSRAAFTPSAATPSVAAPDAPAGSPRAEPGQDELVVAGGAIGVGDGPGGEAGGDLGGQAVEDLGGEVQALPDIVLDVSSRSTALPVRRSIDLASFFPEDAKLVGVAVDVSDTVGTRYVLDAQSGLYVLSDTGAELVIDLRASTVLTVDGASGPPEELTDVAFDFSRSLPGSPSFVLTAENDGYVAGLHNSLLNSYFCYLPPTTREVPAVGPASLSVALREEGIDIKERTEAVALNYASGQIFAQPRTIRLDNGEIAGSELFVFDASGGQPINTRRFASPDFSAGGMVVFSDLFLMLGYGPDLYVSPSWDSDVRRFGTLDGVQAITGMALDVDGHLLVLDGPGKRLVEVDANAVLGALEL